MSKGKVFGKGQILAFLMVVCLAGAVFLNMKFSSTGKYLGEASYVSSTKSKAVKTASNSTEKSDYFEQAKETREKAYKDAEEAVKDMLDTEKLSDEDKQTVLDRIKEIAANIEKSQKIETLLLAKGFKKSVAVLTGSNADIVVKSEGLTAAQTMQIQEIVTTQSGINLSNVKIIAVK